MPNRQPAERMLVELRQSEHLELESARNLGKPCKHLGSAPMDSDQNQVWSLFEHDLLEIVNTAEQPGTGN